MSSTGRLVALIALIALSAFSNALPAVSDHDWAKGGLLGCISVLIALIAAYRACCFLRS
jgi:hypothetical protein